MEPNSREFYKQCAFQKFCNTVLHNEACDAHRELHRHKAREVTFSDLPLDEARQLHTFDDYFLPRCSLVFQQLISIPPEQTIIIEVARPGYDNSKHLASINSLSNLTLINFLSKVLDK